MFFHDLHRGVDHRESDESDKEKSAGTTIFQNRHGDEKNETFQQFGSMRILANRDFEFRGKPLQKEAGNGCGVGI